MLDNIPLTPPKTVSRASCPQLKFSQLQPFAKYCPATLAPAPIAAPTIPPIANNKPIDIAKFPLGSYMFIGSLQQ